MRRHASFWSGLSLLTGVLLVAAAAHAQTSGVYKWTDAQGRVHYGNTPDDASQRRALAVNAGPTVRGVYTDEAELQHLRNIERYEQDRYQQSIINRRDRELHESRLKTEELQQARLRQETELLKARQEAEERCARRGECNGSTGSGVTQGTVVYPHVVVVQPRSRSTQGIQQAAPFPTTPYRTATTESLNRPQIYAPPGNSAIYGWPAR